MKQHSIRFTGLILTLLTLCIQFTSCNNSDSITNSNTSTIDSLQNEIIEESSSFLSKYPLLTWARKNPAEIGCMLETEFSYRDKVFNCSNKDYVNNGDPCIKIEEYYEGINFPDELTSKVNPLIKNLTLEFEHGALRQISITFKDSLLKDQIRNIFNLPSMSQEFPDNVMEISYGENVFSKEKPSNPNYTKWLTITGFEHMGAGDVDCE